MDNHIRKFFFYKNMPIYAVGTLIYKIKQNNFELLLVKNKKNKFEDIGGKVEQIDNDIYDTACREMEEETNSVIQGENIIERIKKSTDIIYNFKSKYLLFLIKADNHQEKLDKKVFGDKEVFSGNDRTIEWINFRDYKNFAKTKKLNYRLMTPYLFKKLDYISNSKK